MTRKESESKARRPSVITENLWLPVQILALGSILFSTVMAGSHAPTSKSEPDSEGLSPIQRISVTSETIPRSITSRVVILPVPDSSVTRSGLSLEIETRQFRFEKNAVAAVEVGTGTGALRAPASQKRRAWRLIQIRRKQGAQWEGVPLVENDRREALGSAFVELEEGWNEFEVVFSDSAGREVSYPVRVNHVRKSTT